MIKTKRKRKEGRKEKALKNELKKFKKN